MSEKIIVLSNKDKVRNMINLYHGSAENHINMIKELIGNSLDIFKKNFPNRKDNKIEIIIHNSNKIEFRDNASGIPVEGIASDGRPNYEAIFEKDCAGSNYGKQTDTVGQHGVFLYTLTMTSENIEYFIARPNGNLYNIKYHKGDKITDLRTVGKCQDTYTKIVFNLDKEVWNNPVFTFEEICDIAQGQCSLMNVEISITDLTRNLNKKFFYQNGIEDFFKEETSNKKIVSENIRIIKEIEDIFKKKGTDIDLTDKIKLDMIFNYSNDENECFQKEFLNTADLIQHGTIQDGIISGLKSSIDKWLENNNKYNKNEKHIINEDIITGLNYICNFSSLYVEYENQIKQRTSVKRYKNIVKNIIEEYMQIFFIENRIQTEIICNQVLVNSRARLNANKTRQNIKKKLQEVTGGKVKIDGLTDCDMRKSKVEDRWLLIVEGKSPKATVVEAYDNTCMGALGLKGRFISCLKKSVEDVLNNAPAYTLIKALGCGIEIPTEEKKKFKDIKSFNKDNLRYGNIGILTDADCWGSGIRLALLTFIYKYLPTLLKENRVYIIISPRYEIKMKNGKMIYAYNDREKEELMKTIDEKDIYNIGIVKGLGEINKEDFWDKVLCPKVRDKTFIQVDYNNIDEVVNKYFEDYMGEDTQPRKDFVKEFITNINLEEIN